MKRLIKKIAINILFVVLPFVSNINILFAQNKVTKMDTLPLLYVENFQDGKADNWQPNNPQNWCVVNDDIRYIYQLNKAGETGKIRKPTSISILKEFNVGNFEFTVDAKCYTDSSNSYRDMCLFFGYQDSVHFYYTHFSGRSDKVHNIIGIVNNADRTKINLEAPGSSSAKLTGYNWHHLKISRNVDTGEIKAYIDDFERPILTAVDTTFRSGKIGVGSFDDTGAFTELKLWGDIIKPANVKDNYGHLPSTFLLSQNYPNPFNSSTNIEFTVPNSQYVSLRIYNLNGRQVASPVFEYVPAGEHRLCWDAANMASGLYFYRLSADRFCEVKQMIFQK